MEPSAWIKLRTVLRLFSRMTLDEAGWLFMAGICMVIIAHTTYFVK